MSEKDKMLQDSMEISKLTDIENSPSLPDQAESKQDTSAPNHKVEVDAVSPVAFNHKPFLTRLYEVFVCMLPLGFIAFGGPSAHIGMLQTQFVDKFKWLDNEKFVELLAVGQGLPGPTSTQMVIAIGASHAGILGGLLAFVLWNVPSFVILVSVALVSRDRIDPNKLPVVLSGLPAAAISLVFIAAYSLGSKVLGNETKMNNGAGQERYVVQLKLALAVLSTIVTLLITGEGSFNKRAVSAAFPALLVFGGICTLLDSKRKGKLGNYFQKSTAEEEHENKSILKAINISPAVGIALIILWLGLLGGFVGLRGAGVIPDEGYAALFEAMFRMGSIIYGGGQVVLPMLLTEVVETGWVTESQFFQGFAIVQSLPGPLFNIAAYLGAVYLGLPGAFVAWIGLFGPGLVLILAFLPFWMWIRKVSWFKCFLCGVNAAAIGLVVAATAQLWEKAIKTWADAATFFFTGAFILFFDPSFGLTNSEKANMSKFRDRLSKAWVPIGIVFGGLLGWMLKEANFAQDFD